jgi:hypothetical protein
MYPLNASAGRLFSIVPGGCSELKISLHVSKATQGAPQPTASSRSVAARFGHDYSRSSWVIFVEVRYAGISAAGASPACAHSYTLPLMMIQAS